MSSITSWMRLEPQSRNAEMSTSLQARIYDPLWLLARQWQLGEFQGEDNGSPVMASWRGESGRLMRYHSGAIAPNSMVNARHYDATRMPLETLVERETIRPMPGQNGKPEKLRLAAEAGQQFLRMLDQQPLSSDYRNAFIRQYPFPELTPEQRAALDTESLGFLDLVGSRVPDGRRLYTEFRSGGASGIVIAPELQIASGDLAEVEKAAELWMQWFEKLFSEPETGNPTWLPERLEYAFSVGTRLDDGERVLTAQEYSEGHLDWYDFDMNLEVTLGGATDNAVTEVSGTAIPAPVSFRGMPAARFWEFEDAKVDFGSVDAGPTDLARMLLVEFALGLRERLVCHSHRTGGRSSLQDTFARHHRYVRSPDAYQILQRAGRAAFGMAHVPAVLSARERPGRPGAEYVLPISVAAHEFGEQTHRRGAVLAR